MAQALYRRYRPQQFSELVGQEKIVRILQQALQSGRIAHAYLFSGPKGTGKTTTARIFAKAVNCLSLKSKNIPPKQFPTEPCRKCDHCNDIASGTFLDLIEIDAASNRGIDEIRELREKVNYPPVSGYYKVYLIDEVHMLTAEASNALLKTLEEPPVQVIFILCTTEIHKILPTVLSRCQRYDFERASLKDIVIRLHQILTLEKVELADSTLLQIAKQASGGYRDAESLLGKLLSLSEDKKINDETASELLGFIDLEEVVSLIEKIMDYRVSEALVGVNHLQEMGVDLNDFIKKMIEYVRQTLLISSGVGEELLEVSQEEFVKMQKNAQNWGKDKILNLIYELNEAKKQTKNAGIPSLPLELCIIKLANRIETDRTEPSVVTEKKSPEKNQTKEIERKPELKPESKLVQIKPKVIKTQVEDTLPETENDANMLSSVILHWQDILISVKPQNHSIEALLKGCRPIAVKNNILHLEFFYPFHKERIESAKSRDIVEDVLSKVMGKKMHIKCILGKKEKKEEKKIDHTQTATQEDLLKAAADIFNGEVVG